MKKAVNSIVLGVILSTSLGFAVEISSWKTHYSSNSDIWIQLKDKPNNVEDWVGIYPVKASNDWDNVVTWRWARNTSEAHDPGDWYKFGIEDGNYEARFFLNNSFHTEDSVPFHVGDVTRVDTQKSVYGVNETLHLNVAHISGDRDWVGIYPKGSNNDWGNVAQWSWVNHNGNIDINGVASGKYEARLFFHNSYTVESKVAFRVGSTLKTSKNTYTPEDTVRVTVDTNNLSGDKDWVGIFPRNADGRWSNVVAWDWVDGQKIFDITIKKKAMPAGDYEVRLFWHNEYGADAVAKQTARFGVAGGGGGLHNGKKKLILHAHSGGWAPMMAKNLVSRRDAIKQLPFSGYGVVGNTFTNEIMRNGVTVNYNDIVEELKGGEQTTNGIKAFNAGKSNFLTVWMRFPNDMWNANTWNKVTQNFRTLAKVANDLGFAGIIYDDEAYDNEAEKLINFDKNGNFDDNAYRNPNKTFFEHTEKITALFKTIMEGMVAEFPSIDVLFYHSPAEGHIAANNVGGRPLITDVGLERQHELTGAMFLGLKQGLSAQASLHDMGEDYTLNTKEHFERAYQWRKHTIASDETNDNINRREHWIVPEEDRASWANDVDEGFMVTNFPKHNAIPELDTTNKVGLNSMKHILEDALERSDEYVIFYSASSSPYGQGVGKIQLDWLQAPSGKYSINPQWKQMMTDVYNNIK